MKNIFFYDTKIGKIGLAENGDTITDLFFGGSELFDNRMKECRKKDSRYKQSDEFQINETELIRKAASQLREYLAGARKVFDLPLFVEGTDFQMKVWNILKTISYGESLSYKRVAEAIGNPKASRAVGNSCNKNPIPIFIPCHRVIGSNGDLVGYAGGIETKKMLLETERKNTIK
ncbi:MAG: methylated-DNA--[protein]-cysteine S-methyltransferase [Clostridia bacterium]|jgi:methylated-DNA-[protein]-cysteine S-methyltransferase